MCTKMAILAKKTAFLPHIAVKSADFCAKKPPFWAKSDQYYGRNLASKVPIFPKRQKVSILVKKRARVPHLAVKGATLPGKMMANYACLPPTPNTSSGANHRLVG